MKTALIRWFEIKLQAVTSTNDHLIMIDPVETPRKPVFPVRDGSFN